ncbi:TonB-dependent receptor [bacterium]|nr:TonB-dependent receptor [bacterium]
MKKYLLVLGMVVLLGVESGFDALAQTEVELAERTEEELLFMEIPIVFAPSKRLQPITEAASSVRIITAQDIKHSGATNIGDVLRSVAGVDIREAHASQHVIGIRGFVDTSHVLVTIDGNNVFMYHANHIFLDWAPLDLEEIDRIEIIKGPGAIFYGGNAFGGVLNIVTKAPGQMNGTQVNIAGGDWDTIRGNIIHAGTRNGLDYSLSAGYRGAEEWEAAKIAQEESRFSVGYLAGKANYPLDAESSLLFAARYSDAQNVISRVCNPKTTFISLRYDRPDFWMRAFYNNHEKTFWDDTFGVADANYELEVLRILRWGNNITSLGGYAKKTAWEVEALKGDKEGNKEKHNVKDYALNVENEYHLNDRLIFTLGARGEYYSLLNYLALGRGSIIYAPMENQVLRFTVGSGYYIPSLFQHTNEGTAYPFALGNSSLKEEKITSYELSYYHQLDKRAKLSASVFYNDYRDLIDNIQTAWGDPTREIQNVADAEQYGGEIEIDFTLSPHLAGFANYSYQHISRDDFGDLAVDPENKFNLGLRAKFAKWSANTTFHYVDEYNEIYLTSNPVFGQVASGPSKVKSYNTVDARIAYSPKDNLELSIAAYNLFNDRHYESNSTGWHTGDKIGRKISAGVSYKF